MPRGFWIVLGAGLIVLAVPADAFAWGPATHVGLGSSVLGGLSLLPVAVASVLRRHPIAYLYGSIAADVVFAKRLSRVKQFCHHWSTAFKLLDTAGEEEDRSFAYGYLSHLAADTVAHGKYVPRQVALSGMAVNVGHFYWELRAEATESRAAHDLLGQLLDLDHSRHHRALAEHIRDTFLSYDLNRMLFDRFNALFVRRTFRRTVEVWSRCSRWYLSAELMAGYRAESLDRILSVLSEGHASPVLREDPNGTSALMQLHVRRREMRRLRRRGIPVTRRLHEASHSFGPRTSRTPQHAGV